MLMPVVKVRGMWMSVPQDHVPVRVAVLPFHRRLVDMIVVPIVVSVNVLVFHLRMQMLVTVSLAKMQGDPACDESCRKDCDRVDVTITEPPGGDGAQERGRCEHRRRPRRSDVTLRDEIEADADAVAQRSDHQEAERGPASDARLRGGEREREESAEARLREDHAA
jgi:hypothetical protein